MVTNSTKLAVAVIDRFAEVKCRHTSICGKRLDDKSVEIGTLSFNFISFCTLS